MQHVCEQLWKEFNREIKCIHNKQFFIVSITKFYLIQS